MSKILLILLILLTIISAYFFVVNINGVDKEIMRLKNVNDELLNQNRVLDSLNVTYMLEIKKKDIAIENLVKQDDNLKIKVANIDSKIKSINYEKANSYSNNFGSEQLKGYFTDSLR